MKKKIALLTLFIATMVFALMGTTQDAFARSYRTKSSDVYVKSYTRKNGTTVKSYYRSKRDGLKYNNYSCLDYGRCR